MRIQFLITVTYRERKNIDVDNIYRDIFSFHFYRKRFK